DLPGQVLRQSEVLEALGGANRVQEHRRPTSSRLPRSLSPVGILSHVERLEELRRHCAWPDRYGYLLSYLRSGKSRKARWLVPRSLGNGIPVPPHGWATGRGQR